MRTIKDASVSLKLLCFRTNSKLNITQHYFLIQLVGLIYLQTIRNTTPKSRMASAIKDTTMLKKFTSRGSTVEATSNKRESVSSHFLAFLTSKDASKAHPKPHLTTLPTELHLKIFKHLPAVPSTCLGLTCKAFYRIHWSVHGQVPLEEDDVDLNTWLPFLLQYWMAPLVLWCNAYTAKFVTVEELRKRRLHEEWARHERVEQNKRVGAARQLGRHQDKNES